MEQPCPCHSGKPYSACCALYLADKQKPETPEALMRSRYTAYTQLNLHYIVNTMKGPALQGFQLKAALAWARKIKWQRLAVLASEVSGDRGYVEFKAYYLYQGQEQCLHERSEFQRENQQWYYVDGKIPPQE